jgi:hypothetical protein
MSGRRGITGVAAVGITLLALSIVGVVANFMTGIELNIDGLLLLAVSLMMAAIFAGILLMLAKQWGWIGKKNADSTPTSNVTAKAPAAPAAPTK